MKAGDKLYCINDYYFECYHYHKKNNFYIIKEINTNDHFNICIYCEGEYEYTCGFDLYDLQSNLYYKYYFITESELRKQKIQKLNARE